VYRAVLVVKAPAARRLEQAIDHRPADRTRATGSIRRDVALNGRLWDLAVQRLAA